MLLFAILTYKMGILELLDYLDIVQLDVEILVHALEGALELDVVLQLDGDLVVDESFEEAVMILTTLAISPLLPLLRQGFLNKNSATTATRIILSWQRKKLSFLRRDVLSYLKKSMVGRQAGRRERSLSE